MKKRILFFVESLSGGGAEKVLVTLLGHLDINKYDITLLSLVDTGVLKDDLNLQRIQYKAFINPSNSFVVNIWNRLKYKLVYQYLPTKYAYRWLLKNNIYDLYVAFTEGFATKLISYAPNPKVAWVHIDLQAYPWTQKVGAFRNLQEERYIYNLYDKVICVSHSVEKVMREYYGLSNAITIYNPIATDDIIVKANIKEGTINTNGFKIVSVGRLVYQKGYDLLIPMIRRLRDWGLNVTLYIIGEGEERVSLRHLIEKLQLESYVHLLGYQRNPYPLMQKMDLFVCSSRAEGYSLVIAEAMVLGLPVVSMNCSGPNELLDNGRYGCLCNTYDDLEQALYRAVSNMYFFQELKKKSKERQSFFDIHKTINQVELLFDSL